MNTTALSCHGNAWDAKVTYEQAKGFLAAWLRGQPRKATIASTLFRDKVERLKT